MLTLDVGRLSAVVCGLSILVSRPCAAQEVTQPIETAPIAPPPAPAESPQALALPEPIPPGSIKLRVRSNQPGVAFHYAKLARLNAELVPAAWTRLCLQECDATLPRGYYRLALSNGAAEPVMAATMLEATRSVSLEGAYTDHSARRTAGWLVLGIGGSVSITNMALGASLSGSKELASATLIGGAVGLLVSLAVGIPLAAWSDDSRVDIRK
jgi:hypothetical protein